jgi:catechol 2,3-dioxygenase-like lactoylglutathione lyase family enzyme
VSPRFDKQGLHNRLQRLLYWDLNVSDLERTREWLEAVTPLRVVAETSADQPFPSVGIEHGRFEGLMMKDATKGQVLHDLSHLWMLHVVEWKDPKPVGTPYLSQANVGWYRINGFMEDTDATLEACVAQGSPPFFPPADKEVNFDGAGSTPHPYQPFCVHDPDGITWEFQPPYPKFGGVPQTPVFVCHNTSDVDRYISFYIETLGLDFLHGAQTREPGDNIYSPIGGKASFDGAMFALRGGPPMFDWLEWDTSRDFPTPYPAHNNLGVIRAVFEVDDLDASYGTLESSRWAKVRRIVFGPPEEWDYGPDYGTRRVLNFADPEGVFFQLQEQVHTDASLHPWGYDSFPS